MEAGRPFKLIILTNVIICLATPLVLFLTFNSNYFYGTLDIQILRM